MIRRKVGDIRYLRHPGTGKKQAVSKVMEILDGGSVDGDWGLYQFQAWLEQDLSNPRMHYISFQYYRNGRYAGQYTFRSPPKVVATLVSAMTARGWLTKQGWRVDRSA